jgi:type IV secretion system protein TrbL
MELIDVVLEGSKAFVRWFISLFIEGLRSGYHTLSMGMFATPTPQSAGGFIMGVPTNDPWSTIYESLVGGEIMLVSLLILVIAVQGRHTARILNIGSVYQDHKARRTAWTGAFFIVIWYWVGVAVLYLVNGFSVALLPEFSSLTSMMVQFLHVSPSNTASVLLLAMGGAIAMWLLEAIFYLRTILLFIYLYGMPIALALAFGQVPVLSTIARRFCERFLPLAMLPLPAAVLFKGYDLIFATQAVSPSTAFLKMVVAVSLPVLAVIVTWKTFSYAAPVTATAIEKTAKGTAVLGGVAAAAYIGGASVATTATRWGPKAAAGHAVAERATQTGSTTEQRDQTTAYRRTENDPGAH